MPSEKDLSDYLNGDLYENRDAAKPYRIVDKETNKDSLEKSWR